MIWLKPVIWVRICGGKSVGRHFYILDPKEIVYLMFFCTWEDELTDILDAPTYDWDKFFGISEDILIFDRFPEELPSDETLT